MTSTSQTHRRLHKKTGRKPADVPASPYVIALRDMLASRRSERIDELEIGQLTAELLKSEGSIWLITRRGNEGGIALRIAFVPMSFSWEPGRRHAGEAVRLRLASAMGVHEIAIRTGGEALEHIRVIVTFTPATPTLVPFMPRDLYPLGANDDPLRAVGRVEAAQRGLNAGIAYFHVDEPAFGNILYFQNLTAMNGYFRATMTSPDGAVGGRRPELGYLLQTRPTVHMVEAISRSLMIYPTKQRGEKQVTARKAASNIREHVDPRGAATRSKSAIA
jgi:hypothetical protein